MRRWVVVHSVVDTRTWKVAYVLVARVHAQGYICAHGHPSALDLPSGPRPDNLLDDCDCRLGKFRW